MKLIYLWIKSYQCIKEKGYSLNAEYSVQYDKQKNNLCIEKKESLDSLLYGDNILITAIVGNNGVGKSTLLDAIRIILFDKEGRKKNIKGFLLYEDEGKLQIANFMNETINWIVDNSSRKIVPKDDIYFPEQYDLMYYSDTLDIKYYLEKFDDDEHVWTDTHVAGFRQRESMQLDISTLHLLKECEGKLLNYFHEDIKRQLIFCEDNKDNADINFLIKPKNLSLQVESLDIKIFDKVLDSDLDSYESSGGCFNLERRNTTSSYTIWLLKKMKQYQEERQVLLLDDEIKWNIWVVYLYNLLSKCKHDGDDYSEIDWKLKRMLPLPVSVESINKILENIFSEEQVQDKDFEDYINFYKAYHKIKKELGSNQEKGFEVDLALSKERQFKELLEFFNCYEKIAYEVDFLRVLWGMSSGEMNVFSLFARIYGALKWSKDQIIFLIDELDSLYHPQLQQEIISRLTRFLRKRFPTKLFQIFITTHSPVVLSDIPKENVIFMEQKDREEYGQTFAANIASLYYDSFFMQNGSIGELARETIVNLFETIAEIEKSDVQENKEEKVFEIFLDKQKISISNNITIEKSRFLLQKLIDTIGEDIWRYKLDKEFHNILRNNTDPKAEIRGKVESLKQEIGEDSVKNFLIQLMEET